MNAHLSASSSWLCASSACRALRRRCRFLASLCLSAVLVACGGGGGGDDGASATQPVPDASAPETAPAAATAGTQTSPVASDIAASACPVATSTIASTPGGSVVARNFMPAHSGQLRPLLQRTGRFAAAPRFATRDYSGPFGGHELRSLYGFPAAVADVSALPPAERAAMGEGQTVYIVVAYHDPAVLEYLEAYSHNYGLPSCSQAVLDTSTPLPLAPAQPGCSVAVVSANGNGDLVPNLPSVAHPLWGPEEALDIQMVHVAAPLARIVVVTARNDSHEGLTGAIKLANRMGNGIVSMSWGGFDQQALFDYDALFRAPGMTYVAGSGDSGWDEQGSWPAAVASVLAVGGTSANWAGQVREESAWLGSGGGMSAVRALPPYQAGYFLRTDTGCNRPTMRLLPDVSALSSSVWAYYGSAKGAGYHETGGTSASAPLWAGMLSAANALRQLQGRRPLANVHQALYQELGRTAASYSEAFYDVRSGLNGVCQTCSATAGYDLSTGLGTPAGPGLLEALAAR